MIAPGYAPAALAILRRKKGGKYHVVEVDPSYTPADTESRHVFGITLEQQRNTHLASAQDLANVVTQRRDLPAAATRDLLVALIALKYTQSNSVCLAVDGQVIGMGAGQQSRIHCTRLAATKADTWYLRQHPAVLDLRFRRGLRRPDRDNAIDQYLLDTLTPAEEHVWHESFRQVPQRLSRDEQQAWLQGLTGVALGSDGFIPFRDNIDRASASGVQYVAQPGGSLRDEPVIARLRRIRYGDGAHGRAALPSLSGSGGWEADLTPRLPLHRRAIERGSSARTEGYAWPWMAASAAMTEA